MEMEYARAMHTIEPSTGDISLEDAAEMVRCSTKTVRRAVGEDRLPRRYVMGARGPMLVFRRDELERWMGSRTRKPRRPNGASRPAPMRRSWTELHESVVALQASLDASRTALTRLTARMQRPDVTARRTEDTIVRLSETLTAIERRLQHQVAALPIPDDGAAPPASPHGVTGERVSLS